MEDIDLIRKKRAIKILISDFFMAAAVITIVMVLTAVVNGWRINSNFIVEQNGLVSIRTKPTGATVFIDGKKESQFSNFSKMLPEGKHKIAIEKTGYERWEKTVQVTPGWLLRLEYPRLFKQSRKQRSIKTFSSLDFFHASPDRSTALLGSYKDNEWLVAENFNGEPNFKNLALNNVFQNYDTTAKKIVSLTWSRNNEKVLMETTKGEWILLDLREPKNSINLSGNYLSLKHTTNLSQTNNYLSNLTFENESGSRLLAINSNRLVRIDLDNKTVSTLVEESITQFKLLESWLFYATTPVDNQSQLKLFRFGDLDTTIVATIDHPSTANIIFNLTRYNSEYYVLTAIDHQLNVFKSTNLPTGGGLKFEMEQIVNQKIGILPTNTKVSANGEFITLQEGSRIIVFDAELGLWYEYDYGDENTRFLDQSLLYRIDEASGKFLVWDFDGTNVRTLATSNAVNTFDALISPNDKNLYYFIKTAPNSNAETTATTEFKLVKENL